MLSSSSIKQKARELGFDLCGIAPAERFPELSFFREWLDRGYGGDMHYLARSVDRRTDIGEVVAGARSVIVTGTNYNTDRPYSASSSDTRERSPGPARAAIARYAWGDDYHDVLKARLDALLAWMRGATPEPFDARAYVDTGPVQERVFGQYAGLGWIGKNTCLINPGIGSWFFLGEIVCTLPLEPDTEGLEQCGSCTRCLEACPTGALVEPGVLDATRCLSYLTIELRGAIPEPQRRALGGHVYGCDICQEVCPFNEAPLASTDPVWQPRPALDLPTLVDLWERSDSELRTLLKRSAMTRAKLTGLRRNLAVAIGNSGDAHAMAALSTTRDDQPSAQDELVQEHVRWAKERAYGL